MENFKLRTMLKPIARWSVMVLTATLIGLSAESAQSQGGHSYPRIGIFHFGPGAPAEWYAKYDLVIFRNENAGFVQKIKSLNPNVIVLPTRDWNRGAQIDPMPEEWIPVNSKGQKINIYSSSTWYTIDFSDYCPRSSRYGNKRFNEYLPEFLLTTHNLSVLDGIATDGLWITPREANGDIDLDRNGRNDFDEHGEAWVNKVWGDGVAKVFRALRAGLPNNKLLVINSGGFHNWHWEESNGLILENFNRMIDFDWFSRTYDSFMNNARAPHALLVDAIAANDKNNFATMRFMLGLTLYGDGYLGFTEDNLHNYHSFYDEFELQLGFPRGDMQQLKSTGSKKRGVWARFFDNGAVIVNFDDKSNSVSDSELRSMAGYDGPYYRFVGGQNPSFNNGARFDQVTLAGEVNRNGYVGDAIFLTKTPTTIVTDIFIDSDNEGTSPANDPAKFNGAWQHINNSTEDAWSLNYKDWKDIWAMAVSPPGNGENTAVFTPNIAVAGPYEVFEWHGTADGQMASNVPHTIKVNNSESDTDPLRGKVILVDQTRRRAQWNSLGVFNFPKGKSSQIIISNKANGIVVADAIRLVYRGDGSPDDTSTADRVPPNPPTGVNVEAN